MAKKKHTVEIAHDVKGGAKLKKAAQQTDKHAKSLDGQAKASKRAHRADAARYNHEKQAILQTAPAAKNFSKMSRSMDGGTGAGGLVRAYALLAANVFALSAAFGVLSRAAQTDTLMQSMKQLEVVTGQSVRVIGAELQKVSGFGMDLAESMRATSLALSAGFDSSAIKDLGEVARNAAVSLGRPMGDALDRIFRGVIKVEPELLDEIGLFVRVKEASAKYASELGIAASELTEFQKRQAFANEAITQGQDKFEAFSDIDTDQFSRLASAFSDIAQEALSFVNAVLKPMIDLIAGSRAVLIGVFSAIIAILGKRAIPALGLFATSAAQAAADAIEANENYRKDLNLGVNAQRAAAEETIDIERKKVLKIRDMLKKARMSGPDYEGQKRKPAAESKLAKANFQLAQKNLGVEARIAALKAKQIALESSKGGQRTKAVKEAQAALDKEIAQEKELLRLSKERLALKDKFPDIKPVEGKVAAQTELKLLTAQQKAQGLATAVSTAEFSGPVAGFGALADETKKLNAEADKGKIKFGLLSKTWFLTKGTAQILTVGIQQMMSAIQRLFIVIAMLAPLFKILADRFNIVNEFTKELDDKTQKAAATMEDMNEKTRKQMEAMFDAAVGTKKFSQANAALSRTVGESAKALQEQTDAYIAFQAQANFGSRFVEGLKDIVPFMSSEATKLQESQTTFFEGLFTGFAGADSSIKAYFAGIKEVADLEAFQIKTQQRRIDLTEALKNANLGVAKAVAAHSEAAMKGDIIFSDVTSKEFLAIQTATETRTMAQNSLNKLMGQELNLRNLAVQASKLLGLNIGKIGEDQIKIADGADNMASALEGAKDAARDFNDSFIKSTKVDKPIAALSVIAAQLDVANDSLSDTERKAFTAARQREDDNEAFLDFLSAREKLQIKNVQNEQEARAIIKGAIQRYRDIQAMLVKNASQLKKISSTQKLISKLTKEESQFAAFNIKMGTQSLLIKSREATAMRKMKMDNANITEAQFNQLIASRGVASETEKRKALMTQLKVTEEDLLAIEALRNAETTASVESRVASATEVFKIEKEVAALALNRVKIQEKLLKLQDKQILLTEKIKVSTRLGGRDLTPVEEAKLLVEAEEKRRNIASQKMKLEIKMLNLQFKILMAEAEILKERSKQAGGNFSINLEDVKNTLTEAQKLNESVIREGYRNATLEAELAIRNKLGEAFTTAFTTGIQSAMGSSAFSVTQGFAAANTPFAPALQQLREERDAMIAERDKFQKRPFEGASGSGFQEKDWKEWERLNIEVEKYNETIGQLENVDKAKLQFLALANAVNQFAENVSKLGSDGVVAATMAEFSLAFVDNIKTLQDSTKEGMDATIERLTIAASMIQNMATLVAATSKAKVDAINKEIEAEKRRDGKSIESLNKIKGLEAKKDQMARKAFERNKKMQIAGAIASTAAGVAGALGSKPWGPWNFVLAGLVGAMGLAQVAIIRKQQYEGGTAGGNTTPASISVGQRSNRVDVSRGATSGELAYLRGDKGIGTTANNFQSMSGAAGLRKGYASGGVIVGEQGPEMIQPYAGFNVVPNDQLGGKPVNAHFTINAIDSRGVEEVLQEQQGNIISMIRQAANDHGEEFIESVNTDHLGGAPKSAGGIDY